MNQLQQIAMLMRGRNPEQVALQIIQNQKIIDPNITQLVQFAQSGNTNDFVNLAQQIFKQRGLNLDDEFNNFMKMLK